MGMSQGVQPVLYYSTALMVKSQGVQWWMGSFENRGFFSCTSSTHSSSIDAWSTDLQFCLLGFLGFALRRQSNHDRILRHVAQDFIDCYGGTVEWDSLDPVLPSHTPGSCGKVDHSAGASHTSATAQQQAQHATATGSMTHRVAEMLEMLAIGSDAAELCEYVASVLEAAAGRVRAGASVRDSSVRQQLGSVASIVSGCSPGVAAETIEEMLGSLLGAAPQ